MKYVKVAGADMPALGFGTYSLKGGAGVEAMKTALKIGYRHIDTAQMYENEAEVGEATSGSGIARSELFITTKVWMTDLKAPQVKSTLAQSLKKLRTDYVDLYLVHWPNKEIPIAETLGAMQALQAEGKVKAFGVSNFTVALLKECIEKLKAPIACNQVEYHALLSQRPVLEYARAHDIVVTGYSPLARGQLMQNSTLQAIGKKYGKTPSQVGLRWLIEQDGVAAIPKAGSEKNARANLDIFDFSLEAEDKQAIAAINGNHRLINPAWAPAWDAA